MSDTTKNQLGALLWKIADELRGAMNADDFRDYMLSFLFFRHLSDNYEAKAQKELGRDYDEAKAKNPDQNPLITWYAENPDDIRGFEDQMSRRANYTIKPKYLWSTIADLARKQSDTLLKTLQDGFKHIEEDSFEETNLKGLFSEVNLDSEKLGKNYTARNNTLQMIISTIAKGLMEFSADNDTLGDAYEYLIEQFAAGSGKKAGEFYTPQRISTILSRIVTLDSQDPASGKRRELRNVLDFACGSGSLLLNVRHEMNGNIGTIYGQEKNITTYNLARMNMILHGVSHSKFEIHHGDSLINDWDILSERNPAKKKVFDAIVANPPFSYRWNPSEELAEDFRFHRYGLAPKSAADFAFLLHGFHFLKDDGTMAIILPHGVLFRGGSEEKIRTKLLKDGHIDAIIGLPANLFFSTGIPVCILVLKKCKKHDDILFINASGSQYFEKGKRQNVLLDEHINKIVKVYQYREETDKKYSRRVSMTEIEQNGYNLNISRYVNSAEEEEQIDLDQTSLDLIEIEKRLEQAKIQYNQFLEELKQIQIP
ncbi:type I restriction-modification system subunit M [Entomospira nematocerorum]|uniref:site-specific DNA-methyltransferase (adenine-specific) n=1 Tax=Entomospira nematocerorum TaxID=2719987 RepID=A0A968GG66_9SPIO|nr:type I restriction-modification system subunit M [Entomospira nematocera]NIZ46551.1 type I restriction-modification system subunit M [Entomospira nematocera]WDI33650.1 type I restriction-modification system subunit M [Entomospira nematocera]